MSNTNKLEGLWGHHALVNTASFQKALLPMSELHCSSAGSSAVANPSRVKL